MSTCSLVSARTGTGVVMIESVAVTTGIETATATAATAVGIAETVRASGTGTDVSAIDLHEITRVVSTARPALARSP